MTEKFQPGSAEGAPVEADNEAVVLQTLEDLAYVTMVLLCVMEKIRMLST